MITEYDMRSVTENPIFSPASGGIRNTNGDNMDRQIAGMMMLMTKNPGTLLSTSANHATGLSGKVILRPV